MPVGDYIRCPSCGNKDDLEAHFEGRKLVNFTCPCGQTFTGRESAGSAARKGKPVDKKREQELLEDAVAGERVTRLLSCELTNDEQREMGLRACAAFDEAIRLEAEAKQIAGDYKAKIAAAEQVHYQLKANAQLKREFRDVDCHQWKNFKRGEVYVVRDDLGHITESRNMTPVERQQELPGEFADTVVEKAAELLQAEGIDARVTSKKKARQTTRSNAASA